MPRLNGIGDGCGQPGADEIRASLAVRVRGGKKSKRINHFFHFTRP
jgi:hypothetical protein